ADLVPEARGTLATLTQMARARRALDVEVCRHPDTNYSNHLRIRVSGLSSEPDAGEFILVKGTTNLRCATDGHIEGIACNGAFNADPPEDFLPPTDRWATVDPISRSSRLRVVEWAYALESQGSDPYLYVVRRRPDRSG